MSKYDSDYSLVGTKRFSSKECFSSDDMDGVESNRRVMEVEDRGQR